MVWPVPGVGLPSSARLSWRNQRSPTHVHNGQDIPAPEGTPVLAAAGGVVTHALPMWEQGFSGYGGHVVVRTATDPSEWHLYAHLSAVDVRPGQTVVPGQLLGSVGRTGGTATDPSALLRSGPHLHFERSPRPYPQPSSAERLDPLPALTGEVRMRTLAELSDLFVKLRAAVVDRSGNLRPGVNPDAGRRALELADEFRRWADTDAPAVFRDDVYARWERRYMAARAELGGAGAALDEVNPDDPTGFGGALKQTLSSTLGAAALGLAAVGVVYLLMNHRR